MRVGENTARLANVRAERVRCGEPQPFQTRAQRSGSRLRACQKYFFDTLRGSRNKPASSLFLCLPSLDCTKLVHRLFFQRKTRPKSSEMVHRKNGTFLFLIELPRGKDGQGRCSIHLCRTKPHPSFFVCVLCVPCRFFLLSKRAEMCLAKMRLQFIYKDPSCCLRHNQGPW